MNQQQQNQQQQHQQQQQNDQSKSTNQNEMQNKNEQIQLLNVNVINEESNAKMITSSSLSIASTNKKLKNAIKMTTTPSTGSTTASSLMASIKNTTLSASKIITKNASSFSRSTSPNRKNSFTPVDSEELKSKKNAKVKSSFELASNDILSTTRKKNEPNEKTDGSDEDAFYIGDENDDDEDDDDNIENSKLNLNYKNLTKHGIFNAYSKEKNASDHSNYNEADLNNDDEDDEDNDDNLDSVQGDLDENYFLNDNNYKASNSYLNKIKPKLKKFSQDSKDILLAKAQRSSLSSEHEINKRKQSRAFSFNIGTKTLISKSKDSEDTLNKKTDANDYNKGQIISKLNKVPLITTENMDSSSINNEDEFSSSSMNISKKVSYLNVKKYKNIQQPIAQPISKSSASSSVLQTPAKTILTNSNKNISSTLLNSSSNLLSNSQRQSQTVSFSEETLKPFSNDNESKSHEHLISQRILKLNRQNTVDVHDVVDERQFEYIDIDDSSLNANNHVIKYNQQESSKSAPSHLISASNLNDENQHLVDSNVSNNLDATGSNLKIKDANISTEYLSSSFSTTTRTLSNSTSLIHQKGNKNQQQPATLKVLEKTMTKGSKAMRIMGNNNPAGFMGNGPLKNQVSCGTISTKSGSSLAKNAIAKKQQQKRLFFKNGNINISRSNIDKRRRRYLTDIFTTLIDLKWRYNLLVFSFGFLISWLAFACTWYLISYLHGDLNELDNKDYIACISGIHGFIGAILFSIETQQTIGYGARYTTEKCPEAIFVMMIQSSVGVMIQSFMVGVVFAKLSRPKKRSETLMFSKNAVISLRDGRLCLICRVGDMRKSHIVEAHVRMYLIKKKVTLEGEIMPLHMYDLNVGWDKGLDRLFLVWPLTIEHYIDQNSPFWTISADDLRKERFELAVILEGIVESTGMTTQARSSYLVNEILWGHRFEKLITFQKEDGTYKIDYSRFNMTVPIDTPTCSAKDLEEFKEQEEFITEAFQESTPSTTNSADLFAESKKDSKADEDKKNCDKGKKENLELSNDQSSIKLTGDDSTASDTNNTNLNNNNNTSVKDIFVYSNEKNPTISKPIESSNNNSNGNRNNTNDFILKADNASALFFNTNIFLNEQRLSNV